MKTKNRISGEKCEVYETAKRKARYGHREWIVWTDRDGIAHAGVKCYKVMKDALLAKGTQGAFTSLGASNGHGMYIDWQIGVQMLRNCKYFEETCHMRRQEMYNGWQKGMERRQTNTKEKTGC